MVLVVPKIGYVFGSIASGKPVTIVGRQLPMGVVALMGLLIFVGILVIVSVFREPEHPGSLSSGFDFTTKQEKAPSFKAGMNRT